MSGTCRAVYDDECWFIDDWAMPYFQEGTWYTHNKKTPKNITEIIPVPRGGIWFLNKIFFSYFEFYQKHRLITVILQNNEVSKYALKACLTMMKEMKEYLRHLKTTNLSMSGFQNDDHGVFLLSLEERKQVAVAEYNAALLMYKELRDRYLSRNSSFEKEKAAAMEEMLAAGNGLISDEDYMSPPPPPSSDFSGNTLSGIKYYPDQTEMQTETETETKIDFDSDIGTNAELEAMESALRETALANLEITSAQIGELAEQLESLTEVQQVSIDSIEVKITETKESVEKAEVTLIETHVYQKKVSCCKCRLMLCLFLLLLIVAGVIAIVVLQKSNRL
jgi:hypothetical protein